MIPEAKLRDTEHGKVPDGEGWFVVNARESPWIDDGGMGVYTKFEGEARFPLVGVNLAVISPGQPSAMYHGEDAQEDFLVLSGECLLLIEEEERTLGAWDFVHCPAWTRHIFVGAGGGPCAILMIGTRIVDDVVYPRSELALRHGAGVEQETKDPDEAYARFERNTPTRFDPAWLPELPG
jgi:uncharacterized cupin superfamily protein